MPRCARVKSYDSIYHIMIRSIDEVPLFIENTDKDTYLSLIKEYQIQYGFKLYAYCLMDNHGHLIIDANGADISKIMHGINFTYARKYNKFHKRRGHLFQDRFKSKIIKNEKYIITLSAYIHNNPKDIFGYERNLEKYKYSSLSVYLGIKKDTFGILDEAFIMQLFGSKRAGARKNYQRLVSRCTDIKISEDLEFKGEKTLYKSERKLIVRDVKDQDIINYVAQKTHTDSIMLHMKNSRNTIEAKALSVLLMRNLCNYKCRDICKVLGNITQSRVSKLCSIGLSIIGDKPLYRNIISSFIQEYSV
jgi:putative transposase